MPSRSAKFNSERDNSLAIVFHVNNTGVDRLISDDTYEVERLLNLHRKSLRD